MEMWITEISKQWITIPNWNQTARRFFCAARSTSDLKNIALESENWCRHSGTKSEQWEWILEPELLPYHPSSHQLGQWQLEPVTRNFVRQTPHPSQCCCVGTYAASFRREDNHPLFLFWVVILFKIILWIILCTTTTMFTSRSSGPESLLDSSRVVTLLQA